MSYSLKHILYHAALRGVRAPFVNSISTQRPLRSVTDSVTRTGYCRCFSAAFETTPCSVPRGLNTQSCKLRCYFWVRTDSLLSSCSVRVSLNPLWLSLCVLQIFTRYGKCYTFNSGQDGRPLLVTMKGGMGNGLELMLDIQQDEYLPVWGETGKLPWRMHHIKHPITRSEDLS